MFEIEGNLISNAEGTKKNQDHEYIGGSKIGKLIFLGILENSQWFDAANCHRTKAVQNSVDENLKIKISHLVDKEMQDCRKTKLFFTAKNSIEKGEVLKFDFRKQIVTNRVMKFPFVRHPFQLHIGQIWCLQNEFYEGNILFESVKCVFVHIVLSKMIKFLFVCNMI